MILNVYNGIVFVNSPVKLYMLHLSYVPEGSATRKVCISYVILYKSNLGCYEFSIVIR